MQTDNLGQSKGNAHGLALGAGTAGIMASLWAAPNLIGLFGATLALLMVAIAAIDARYFIIPDELNAVILVVGVGYSAAVNPQAAAGAIALAIARSITLSLLFFFLRTVYRQIRHRDGIGLGDVKLAGAAGAWLEWPTLPITIEMAALAALTIYAWRQRALGRSLRSSSRLPFGLFFAPAIWFGWLLQTLWLASP